MTIVEEDADLLLDPVVRDALQDMAGAPSVDIFQRLAVLVEEPEAIDARAIRELECLAGIETGERTEAVALTREDAAAQRRIELQVDHGVADRRRHIGCGCETAAEAVQARARNRAGQQFEDRAPAGGRRFP